PRRRGRRRASVERRRRRPGARRRRSGARRRRGLASPALRPYDPPMLDWLGSVQIRKRTSTRVELELTRATAWAGWIRCTGGGWLAALAAAWSIVLGVFVIAAGVLLGTLRRSLV